MFRPAYYANLPAGGVVAAHHDDAPLDVYQAALQPLPACLQGGHVQGAGQQQLAPQPLQPLPVYANAQALGLGFAMPVPEPHPLTEQHFAQLHNMAVRQRWEQQRLLRALDAAYNRQCQQHREERYQLDCQHANALWQYEHEIIPQLQAREVLMMQQQPVAMAVQQQQRMPPAVQYAAMQPPVLVPAPAPIEAGADLPYAGSSNNSSEGSSGAPGPFGHAAAQHAVLGGPGIPAWMDQAGGDGAVRVQRLPQRPASKGSAAVEVDMM